MDPVVEALKLYIGENMTYLIVILVAIIALACWLTAKYVKMKNKIDRVENLPCSHHSGKLEAHDVLLSRMEGQLEILVGNSIEKGAFKIRKKSGSEFSKKHSPRMLNEIGEKLLKKCGGEKFLDEYADFFIDKINQLQPKTALDVENYALAVLKINTKEDMFIPLKNWVYNEPTWTLHNSDGTEKEQDIELDDIIFVLSLPLRDKYLEIHKDIIP